MTGWTGLKHTIRAGLVVALLAGVVAPFVAVTSLAEDTSDVAPDVDVVGLRLGMTPDEAMAALAAYNPDLRVTTVSTDITMRDSRRENVTLANYLGEIRADWQYGAEGWQRNDHQEHISVVFASPPAEPRAIQIRRYIRYVPGHGPGYLGVVAAIDGKYGEATNAKDSDQSVMRLWQYDGWRLSYNLFGKWLMELGGTVSRHGPGRATSDRWMLAAALACWSPTIRTRPIS